MIPLVTVALCALVALVESLPVTLGRRPVSCGWDRTVAVVSWDGLRRDEV